MPAQETVELRALSDQDLGGELEGAHQALFNLRFQASTRQLANVAQVSKARRRIARIKTLLHEREIIADADREADQAAEDTVPPAADGDGAPDDAEAPDDGAAAEGAGEADGPAPEDGDAPARDEE